jgi:hypothetical protein
MKKGLLALLLVAVSALTFGISALGAGTGNLVIHFQNWSGDYENLGNWTWAPGLSGKVHDGVDDFGAYWQYNDIPVGTEVPFIGVYWTGTTSSDGPDWNRKLTDDVFIPADAIVEDETVHVYIFEGKFGNGNAKVFVSDPTTHNVLAVYYDPAGAYEEGLGIHGWGWTYEDDPEVGASQWGTPSQLFQVGGISEANIDVWGMMLSAKETWAGFLVYGGDDATKKTGDINDGNFITNKDPGAVNIVYIVNAGDGVTNNSNVFTTSQAFRDEAFSFKLLPFSPEEMSGTYAIDPRTLVVKTSAAVASPYAAAVNDAEREAAEATIQSWFEIKEALGNGQYGDALEIERVDFGKTNTTLNTFVIALAEGSELDNTKDYEVFFDTNYPQDLETAKEIEVTINVTVPDNTPENATISLGASFGGWSPDNAAWAATKQSDGTYSITFTISVTAAYSTHEYKWTQGTWDIGENLASGNRSFVLSNDMTSITFNDEILAWDTDADKDDTKYAATARTVFVPTNASASLALDLDTEAPVLTFVSPLSFVGKEAADRIIEVPWGQPFDQSLFPRYSVTDNREGDITSFVFVPKGEMSVLNTAEEGDYVIMLQVEDKWGNVTQETFIFRVVKGE